MWVEYYIQIKTKNPRLQYLDWVHYKEFGYANLEQALSEKHRLELYDSCNQYRIIKKTIKIEVME